MANPKNRPPTLCWFCVRSRPIPGIGCCWARRFKPVQGWDAIPSVISARGGQPEVNTYRVVNCPLYVADACTPKAGTDFAKAREGATS